MDRSNKALRRCPVVCDPLEPRRLFAFSLTTTSTSYNIDTNAGVTFSILRGGSLSSTIHLGDMTSFKLNGVEFSAPYSVTSRYAHFESGLSSSAVLTATVDPSDNWIKITCDDTTATAGAGGTGVIQYYIAKKNDPTIYLATYAPEMKVSSTRFIAYLDRTKFPNMPDESDVAGGTGAIESGDVQGFADGTTASKYYGETRNIDHLYHGATGPNAGAFMFIGDRESGAGGPFWKDIDFQSGSAVEIYNMPFSGHSLTDTFRPGLHGPYAMVLTNGAPPTTLPDYTFLDDVGLAGWVSPQDRGSLSGVASGVAAGRIMTVGLSNAEAQYWDTPDAAGNYAITGIKPGTYTQSLYDEELVVGTRTVTISAGQSTRANITATAIFGLNGSNNTFSSFNAYATPIWRIGTWDGTPREFLNGDKITIMHPQDVRLSPWAADATGMTNFTIGTNTDKDWPLAEWKTQVGGAPYVDTKNRITFNLTAGQRAQGLTLRIGVTRLSSVRPGVSANGGTTAYSSTIISQPEARGVSLGNWRGNNGVYSYSFAANSLLVGTNTFDLYAISGSTFSGYFSGYHIYDAIDLIPTSSAAVPNVATMSISPGHNTNIRQNASRVFSVIGNTTSGQRPVNAVWTSTRGTINDAGEYIAPATPGTDTITATLGGVSSSITINVTTTTPSIAAPAMPASPVIYNNTTMLSVLGDDDSGEAALNYTWGIVGTQPGTVTFGAGNGTNAAKNLSATFSAYGVYTLQATITDGSSNSTVSQTRVVVQNEHALFRFDQPNGVALTDHSGNGRTGTVTGSFEYVDAIDGKGLRLINGAATLPNGIVDGLTEFSFAAWIKPDALANWARIFDFGTSDSNYMFLTPRAGVAGSPLRFAIKNTASANEQIVNGPTLTAGVWTHVGVTLAGNVATLWVNGKPVGTNSSMSLSPASLGAMTRNFIGESQFAADPTFAGTIDDLRIYARALNLSEMAMLGDTVPPQLVNGVFNPQASQAITLNFNEDVFDSLSAADFVITDLATNQTVPFTFSKQGVAGSPSSATLTPSPLLPDGNFRVTISNVADLADNALPPASYDFWFLNADANRDRIVDTQDFNRLAANFGFTGKVFAEGNFDFDASGVVDSVDFNLLISRFGKRLAPPAAPQAGGSLFSTLDSGDSALIEI